MKIHKIIGLGLVFATAVASFVIFSTGKVSALSSDQTDILNCVKNLQFVNYAEIDCTFTPVGQTEPTTAKFIDPHPDDPDPRCDLARQSGGCAHQMNFPETTGFFCEGEPSSGSIVPGTKFYESGITIQPNNGDIGSGPLKASDASKRVKLVVNVRYQGNSSNCVYPDGYDKDNLPNNTISEIATQHIADYLQFTAAGISSLDGVKDGVLADGNWSLTSYQEPGNTLAFVSNYAPNGINGCSGDIIFTSAGSKQATRYSLNNDNNLNTSEGNSDLINFLRDSTWGTPGCGQNAGQRNFFGTATTFNIFGTPPSGPNNANTPAAGGTAGPSDACYQSGWDLSWLFCPLINAAQTSANAMYGFVEKQLRFTIDQQSNSTTDSLGETHASVHSAWNNFRILVSGLVVILLLVMVISQAIGSGPFDAYTIKKMLPKLVIGVLLIQISWPVFSWVINIVDDIGVGLADIMYAPFGGANALDLKSVMAPFGTEAVTFNWVGILALGVFGIVAPFIVLGLILTVLVAIFVGFLTLLFRKIIIILALIFAPVALIAWMIPGMQSYWKLWWSNFIKALMMFPLIVAMIAGGRIFAKIGSGQSDFVGFFIVLVGFFGPLFILPKTFKWGGTLMQTAGQGISSAGQKGLKKPKEFLGERQKGYSEERTRKSRERYLRGEGVGFNRNWQRGFGVPSLWRRPIDLVRSGQVDPTLWGRRKETAMRKYRASGAESEEADIKAADQELGLLASQSTNHDDFVRLVGGARIGDEVTWTDRFDRVQRMEVTADMKRAGMNGMAKFGTDRTFRELSRILNELNHGGAEEQILAERFRDANVGNLKPKMDYLYRGQSRVPGGSDAMPDWVLNPNTGAMDLSGPVASRVGSLTPDAFAQMEAPELEAILAGLSQVANHHRDAAARAAAEDRLRTIYTHYEGALNNNQIARSMGTSLNQAMKAHLDGTGIVGINDARTQARLTTHIEQVAATTTPATQAIANRIGADGTVT